MPTLSRPDFKYQHLWQQAMTHRSFANEQANDIPHNERLEFLGDAILTFLSGDYLYARYPDKSEGELTTIRAALVDQPQLCCFAQALSLEQALRLGKGAEKEGARQSTRLLCSAFEAMIGAYFLDVEREMQRVKAYVFPFFDTVVAAAGEQGAKDEKTRLQEWAHRTTGEAPEYVDVESSGPDHDKSFVIEVRIAGKAYAQGRGKSKKKAQKAAAKAALSKIESF
ncbi:MAG: ribonuclease III [Phormidesmis sp.]